MPATYRIAQAQAAAARAAAACPNCGHADGDHREYPRENPRYRPLLFTCGHDGCDCERDLRETA